METALTILGLCGVAVNLTAYFLLSAGRMKAHHARYQWLNIGGTLCILLSLVVQWNLPAFLLNLAWLMIAIVGITHIYKRKARGWK